MNRRSLALWVTLAAVVSGAPSVTGQAGHPDLQGVWLNNSATPLERPETARRTDLSHQRGSRGAAKRADRLFKNTNADFAAGDAVYLAALADIDRFKSTTATGSTFEMIEREFDNRTSLIVDPPDGRIPPLTQEAQRGERGRNAAPASAEGPEDLNHVERCLTYGVPRLSSNNTGAGPSRFLRDRADPRLRRAVSRGDTRSAHHQSGRTPHLPASVRLWQGDSRGRWDGQTLVDRHHEFLGEQQLHGLLRPPASRRALDASRARPNRLRESPSTISTTWTRPWTAVIRLKRSAERLFEYGCHEGNYEIVRGMLAAARAIEAGR
jgi:hypothetical protein